MTKDEALRLALEALEYTGLKWPQVEQAITAIKAALEAEDEPVAFKIYKPTPPRHAIPNVRDAELPWVYDQDPSSGNVASMWVTPVKATPQQQEAKDEPVAWRYDQAKYRTNDLRGRQWAFNVFSQARPYMDEMVQNVTPLYTTPPQRKPLVFGLNDDGQFTFSVGVQTFTLDYFPENDEETEFMKRQLTHAIKAALEAKDEPVKIIAYNCKCGRTMKFESEHGIVAPQRTWVGLTDEEIEQGCKESWVTEQAFQSAVWWAEQKLKERNT